MTFLRRSPPSLFLLLLTLTPLLSQISPAHSLCASQKFTNRNLYIHCTDLPTLNAALHWTFTAKNSTLSVAFIAPPAKPAGWIAWAINPTQTAMAGSQALIATKSPNGSMTVDTYNISSYSSVEQGKIAYEVPQSSAEFSGGVMRIFATVKLLEDTTELNHVWQVGGEVMEGSMPAKHEFLPANLNAMGKLKLGGKAATPVGSPAAAPSPSSGATVGSPVSATNATAPTTSYAGVDARMSVVLMGFGCLLGFW